MKKLTALLAAAMFSLAAAVPASAAPSNAAPAANNMEIIPVAPAANDNLAMVPATKAVKSGQKHKKIKKAKHKRAKAKAKARVHKRAHRR